MEPFNLKPTSSRLLRFWYKAYPMAVCTSSLTAARLVGVVYKKRTLPIAWMVAKKRKEHFSEAFHLELIRKVEQLIPEDAQVTLLGDGEFDGVNLQALVQQWHWDYVLRTGKNITLSRDGTTICYEDLSANIKPGELFYVPNASFSNRGYGPVLAITVWGEGCKEPIHLVTNMGDPGQAYLCYCKRFRIETFFSDQKSRGFHLNKSHLSDPERICRFMIATSLAYFLVIYLGVYAINFGYHQIIHRTDRCDLVCFSWDCVSWITCWIEKCPYPGIFTHWHNLLQNLSGRELSF